MGPGRAGSVATVSSRPAAGVPAPRRPRLLAVARAPRVARAALVALAVAALSGCGGGTSAPAPATVAAAAGTERALTLDEAGRLAGALRRNADDEGAVVRVRGTIGQPVAIDAVVSWPAGQGRATVVYRATASGAGAGPPVDVAFEVRWSGAVVLERHRDLGAAWFARPADTKNVPLDWLLGVLSGLATRQADNPSLVQQADAAYRGRTPLDGTDLDVMRYGRNLYWLDDTGLLRRFQTPSLDGRTTLTFDFSERGAKLIPAPDGTIVETADRLDEYAAVARRTPVLGQPAATVAATPVRSATTTPVTGAAGGSGR